MWCAIFTEAFDAISVVNLLISAVVVKIPVGTHYRQKVYPGSIVNTFV